jgi:hypothetical protein
LTTKNFIANHILGIFSLTKVIKASLNGHIDK